MVSYLAREIIERRSGEYTSQAWGSDEYNNGRVMSSSLKSQMGLQISDGRSLKTLHLENTWVDLEMN